MSKYCSKCGKPLYDEEIKCPECGTYCNEKKTRSDDKQSIGLNILSLIIPLVGLIGFFVCKKEKPIKAKGLLIFGIIGWVANMVIMMSGMV